MNLRITLLAFLCLCATAILRAERVDMLKAGAKANGKALNTKLINSTIDRLNRGGGGTLFFPAGTYLTGSIHLKSNITLELEAGATLLFSDNFDDYLPFVEVRHEGVMMKSFQPLSMRLMRKILLLREKVHWMVKVRSGGWSSFV